MFFVFLFRRMLITVKKDISIVVPVAIGFNLLFGLLFYFFERGVQDITFLDSLWWAMVTMTTVGYGDFYAKTFVGRFFISYPCMIFGIGIIGYVVGVFANFFLNFTHKYKRGLMDLSLKNHIIICNYPSNKKIREIIKELRGAEKYKDGTFALLTDSITELPDDLQKMGVYFFHGEPTDEETLYRAGIIDCEGIIILAEDPTSRKSDERTYMIGSLIEMISKEKKTSIKTILEIVSMRHIKNIIRADVDGYISEDGMAGRLIVQEYLNPGINKVITQCLTNHEGSQFYFYTTKLHGYKIRDIQIEALNQDINLQVIGLKRKNTPILNPPKSTVVEMDDKLIILAENDKDFLLLENNLLK